LANFSTSTSALCATGPCASFDVGQDIRIAVLVQATDFTWDYRVEPNSSRNLDDARPHLIAENRAGQHGAAIIEDADDVAVCDFATPSVVRMDTHRLAPSDLTLLADDAHVHLAMEPRRRLGRQQMQWILRRVRPAEPFSRRQPDWMAGAVVIAALRAKAAAADFRIDVLREALRAGWAERRIQGRCRVCVGCNRSAVRREPSPSGGEAISRSPRRPL